MAKLTGNRLFYNFILIAVLLILLAVSLAGMDGVLTSVALEQDVCCGAEEHIHGADCYAGDILMCPKKAHTHRENCYLLLLRENDINWLLDAVAKTETKALKNLMESAIMEALRLTSAFQPGQSAVVSLSSSSIAALNTAMQTQGSYAPLTLNANLDGAVNYALLSDGNGGISTYAVGGTPDTTTKRAINFYIMLDGKITFVSLGELFNTNPDQYSYSDIVNAYKQYLVTNLSTSNVGNNSTYRILYKMGGGVSQVSDFTISPTYHYSYGYNMMGFRNNNSQRYALLTDSSNQAINFYTVTLDYSAVGGTNQVEYVERGLDSTLSLGNQYLWVDLGDNPVDATKLDNIAATTYLKAKPKNYTATFFFFEKTISENTIYHEEKNIIPGDPLYAPDEPSRDGYTFGGWYDNNGDPVTFPVTMNANKTFYAKWDPIPYTVTFKDPSGKEIKASETKTYGEKVTLPEGYTWRIGDVLCTGNTVTVTGDTDLVGTIKTYNVTYRDKNGDVIETLTVNHGTVLDLPDLEEGYRWVTDGLPPLKDTETHTVTSNVEFQAQNVVQATYHYANGNVTTSSLLAPGSTLTLPSLGNNRVWIGSDGKEYAGGTTITLNDNMSFTESPVLTVSYNVNFTYNANGRTFYSQGGLGANPSLLGASAVGVPKMAANLSNTYTVSGVSSLDAPLQLENLNYREVFYQQSGSPAYEYRCVYFLGWEATVNGQTVLFQPGETIDWDKLQSMATNGTVTLKGKWESSQWTTVTFYVNYRAKAVNAGGDYSSASADDYTPEVFCGYLFGIPSSVSTSNYNAYYHITGATAATSVDADVKIRQLYGTGVTYDLADNSADTTLYMLDFPTDEEVLARIKLWAAKGLLPRDLAADNGDGTTFNIPYTRNADGSKNYYDLDTDHYTVRWYVFKSQSDGWHVDGRLIKKVGTIKVTKDFGGNASLVEAAIQATKDASGEKAFVKAVCDGYYRNVDGVETFVPYTTPRTERLYFYESTREGDGGYTYDATTGTYSWIIEEVEANERWVVTEFPETPESALDISEWVWVDSYNGTSDSGTTQSTTVTGITQAADIKTDDWLTVDFTNIYHKKNTILIRKVDGKTMTGLPGAVFNLYQTVDGEEKLMHFTYNDKEQVYEWDQTNTGLTDLTVNDSGFLEYTVSGFSYDAGDIIVREVEAPNGYALASDITVGYTTDSEGNRIIGIVNSESNDAAEYQNGVLTVKNYSDGTAQVTAEKVWDCDPSYYKGLAVRFELLANGRIASNTIPGFATTYGSYYVYLDEVGAYVTKNADGTPNYISRTPWSYTWEGLPTVIGGESISYSILESQVGDEVADSSGNLPNWINDELYNTVSTDDKGNQTVSIAIRNTPNRAMIRLTKYDVATFATLPYAKFTLTELDKNGNDVTSLTAVTDQYGIITFDNLKYETWYRLDESAAPPGYIGYEAPAYIKLAKTGVVTVASSPSSTAPAHGSVYYPNQSNNVVAFNQHLEPLPETGGMGTTVYTQTGLLLILAALVLLCIKKHRREDDPSYV